VDEAIGGLNRRLADDLASKLDLGARLEAITVGAEVHEPERGEQVQVDAVPGELAPASLLHSVAEDPRLIEIDTELNSRNRDDPPADRDRTAGLYKHERELRLEATGIILERYGVPPEEISIVPSPSATEFRYEGNFVRITTLDDVTEVHAWSDRLSPEQRQAAETEHQRLIREGADIAAQYHYQTEGSEIPRHLSQTRALIAAGQDIEGAYSRHVERVLDHSVETGFRYFQVYSPGGMRLGIPVALQVLQYPPEQTSPIVGEHSETGGEIAVDRAGVFRNARRSEPAWSITDDGRIERTS
jgi:hypothetical protein